MFDNYPDILSPNEACEVLRIGENALYDLLRTGKLKALKNGRNWLIPKEAAIKYVMQESGMEPKSEKELVEPFVGASKQPKAKKTKLSK